MYNFLVPERNPSTQKSIELISIIAPLGTIVQMGPAPDSEILPLPKDSKLILLDSEKQNTVGHLRLEFITDEDKHPCYLQIPEEVRSIIRDALKRIEKYSILMNSGLTASVRKQMGLGGESIIFEREIEKLPVPKQKLLSGLFNELERIASQNPFD